MNHIAVILTVFILLTYEVHVFKLISLMKYNQRAINSPINSINHDVSVKVSQITSLTNTLDYLDISSKGNTTKLLLLLVDIGDRYYKDNIDNNHDNTDVKFSRLNHDESDDESSQFNSFQQSDTLTSQESYIKVHGDKVKGCLSNVWILTTVDHSTGLLHIQGIADSRVSRGMLALILNVCFHIFIYVHHV